MSVLASPTYAKLLAEVTPSVIKTEAQNERYTAMLYALDQKYDTLTAGERQLADLLTLLIEDFEAKRYQLPKASPLDALLFLMDQHGLRQKDLIDVFGTASIASEVLNGKRDLSKAHISRLSERFHVSPELFF